MYISNVTKSGLHVYLKCGLKKANFEIMMADRFLKDKYKSLKISFEFHIMNRTLTCIKMKF